MSPLNRARIPHFYRHTIAERLAVLVERDLLSPDDAAMLARGGATLAPAAADKMVENVICTFGLPLGLGLNFVVDGASYVVPMVVEEASVVAAVSASAKLVAAAGGFTTEAGPALMIGQVQIVEVAHPAQARSALLQHGQEILDLANSLHPNMVARGGGAKEIEVHTHPLPQGGDMLVLHLLVDSRDAMGANLVNTMCEGVASYVESLTSGRVFLRILSNLTDRALVTARATLPAALLAGRGYRGEVVRDKIIAANDFAVCDPHRAATHNKGVMNGIDAVALATGNDWRAIEAAAHAYAGRGASYTALTQWRADAAGALVGEITLPLKVGTVGGNLQANPAVALAHRLLRVDSAAQLARLMAAVGLAQNLGALKALVTDGIQRGHMTLHARSVVASAQVPEALFDQVVERLVEGQEIKVWRAKEIYAALLVPGRGDGDSHDDGGGRALAASSDGAAAADAGPAAVGDRAAGSRSPPLATAAVGLGHGKVLLLGEHAAIYGSHVLAAPLAISTRAQVEASPRAGVRLVIPAWGVEGTLPAGPLAIAALRQNLLYASLAATLGALDLQGQDMTISVFPSLPRAMGLGGSAALAVAVIRALSVHFGLGLSDVEVDALAFDAEKLAHGTPSGVDNTLATYGQTMLFQRGSPPSWRRVALSAPVSLVIGMSGVESLTAKMVVQVEVAWRRRRALYEGIFSQIDQLALQATAALEAGNIELTGELMNVNQGLLNALGVSSWELEELIGLARKHGALGAKLTGAGGGGSMVALCPADGGATARAVGAAMAAAGYRWFHAGLTSGSSL